MFFSDTINVTSYNDQQEQLKKLNADWLALRQSREYRTGLVLNEIIRDVKNMRIYDLLSAIRRWKRGQKTKAIRSLQKNLIAQRAFVSTESNYFSQERIAIYTAIFGTYDKINIPYCRPDNCDYYIFTDQDINRYSNVWKKKEINLSELDGLSNAQKNRYLKMHPHKLFPDYNYSIYVDGNVLIINDLTEYVNRLNDIGIGLHTHDARSCVYEELEAIAKSKRETTENIKAHIEHLHDQKMPINYGLLQCNVIVREHHNKICVNVMEQWWDEYIRYTKRDQVSLPYVLYKSGIKVKDVGMLGANIYINPSFRVLSHQ